MTWKECETKLKHSFRRRLTPSSTQRLKKIYNSTKARVLYGRAWVRAVSSEARVKNVFHACVQKTGSQWIRSVFEDPRFRQASGLATFPQFRYEWGDFRSSFPKHTYVPGLYISRGLYEEIEKPESYKTIYVLRDPRDTVVSWYYSMRDSHSLMGKVGKHRRRLRELEFDGGLAYCIRAYHLKFAYMRSWAYAEDDPHTLFVKLEDLADDPVAGFKRIVDHCSSPLSRPDLEEILADYTKEKMRERDRRVRDDNERSHYREESTGWREEFTDEHLNLFRDITGNLVELLGYESA